MQKVAARHCGYILNKNRHSSSSICGIFDLQGRLHLPYHMSMGNTIPTLVESFFAQATPHIESTFMINIFAV